MSTAKAVAVDAFCHSKGIPFIRGDVRGVFGSLFCDFGAGFNVLDTDGRALDTRVPSHQLNLKHFRGIRLEWLQGQNGLFNLSTIEE